MVLLMENTNPAESRYDAYLARIAAEVETGRFVVVADRHTAQESTWTTGESFATRAEAIARCDRANEARTTLGGITWHVEQV